MKKKQNAIILQIKEPCSESFEDMQPIPGGNHCDRCEKTIVDFTGMTDVDIVRMYQKKQGRICGQFTPGQLNRPLFLPPPIEKRSHWKAVAAFAAALTMSHLSTSAQSLDSTETITYQANNHQTSDTGFNTITGQVMDENDEPLIGASILIGPGEGTVSDIDGTFELRLPANIQSQLLTISYTGFKKQELTWTKGVDSPLAVVMQLDAAQLPEVVVTGFSQPRIKGKLMGMVAHISEEVAAVADSGTLEEKEEELEMEQPYTPSLEVFPNPFIEEVQVSIEVETPDAFLFHLYNESGQLLFAETHELSFGTAAVRLDLSRLSLVEGMYFLRISDSIGEVRTKRIVKMAP